MRVAPECEAVGVVHQQVGFTGLGVGADDDGPAFGQQFNQYEVVEVEREGGNQQRQQWLQNQRQGNAEEVVEHARAFQPGGFVQVFRDRLQHAQAQNEHVGVTEPGVHKQNHRAGGVGVGIPVRSNAEQAFQNEVDLPEVLVEQGLENHDRNKAGQGIGQNQQQLVQRPAADRFPLHQRGQRDADNKSGDHGEGGEQHRPGEDLHEGVEHAFVGEDAFDVVEAHVHGEPGVQALAVFVFKITGFEVGANDAAVLLVHQVAVVVQFIQRVGGGELSEAGFHQLGAIGQYQHHSVEFAAQFYGGVTRGQLQVGQG